MLQVRQRIGIELELMVEMGVRVGIEIRIGIRITIEALSRMKKRGC